MIHRLGERVPRTGEALFIAPNAAIIGSVALAAGSSVWFGATLRGDNDWIRVGEDSNIQDGAVLHTDPGIELTIGRRVTVGHRAVLHGCRVGDESLIGIGATVLNGASIGSQSIVGAGALVTEGKSFPDGVLLIGAPAKIVRELDTDELAALARSADVYVAQSRRYRDQLAPA